MLFIENTKNSSGFKQNLLLSPKKKGFFQKYWLKLGFIITFLTERWDYYSLSKVRVIYRRNAVRLQTLRSIYSLHSKFQSRNLQILEILTKIVFHFILTDFHSFSMEFITVWVKNVYRKNAVRAWSFNSNYYLQSKIQDRSLQISTIVFLVNIYYSLSLSEVCYCVM